MAPLTPPAHSPLSHRRAAALLRTGLILLPSLLTACASMDLRRAARESGVKVRFQDPSPVVGTFENISAQHFGSGYAKLWDQLRSTNGPFKPGGGGASGYGDEVRISSPPARRGFLEIALLTQGQIRQTARMPYAIRGNYLYLGSHSDFEWLPLGYAWCRFDLGITGNGGNGDLVVLSRFEFQGIAMLVGNDGDCSTIKMRFPRTARKP